MKSNLGLAIVFTSSNELIEGHFRLKAPHGLIEVRVKQVGGAHCLHNLVLLAPAEVTVDECLFIIG